jgi:hypothetical protein
MTDFRQLREIEKLVQDSVFHPSPRHHLRERVLQHAVRAKHRQKLWQRFAVASSAVTGTLLFGFVAVRLLTPGPTTASNAVGPVRVQIYSPGHTARLPQAAQTAEAPRASLGEDLYFGPRGVQHGTSPQAPVRAIGFDPSNPSTTKDLAASPE